MITPERIVKRAAELGIGLWVEGDKIKYRGKKGTIPVKMGKVLKAHKEELIAYLNEQGRALLDDLAPSLCFKCLNDGKETPAHFVGPEDMMYCQHHYSGLPSEWHKIETERMAEAYRKALPGWKVTVEPRGKPGTQEEEQADYWTRTQARLTQKGYYERVKRDEERFRQHVPVPRIYPAPFPAYALVDVDGVKTLQGVGMWHATEDRLLTEGEFQAKE